MSFKSLKSRFEKRAPEVAEEKDEVMEPVVVSTAAEGKAGVLDPMGNAMLFLPAAAESEVTHACQICGHTIDECASYHSSGYCDYDMCEDCGSVALTLQSKSKPARPVNEADLRKAVAASGKLEARALEKKRAAAKAKAAMHTGVKAITCPKGKPLFSFPAPATDEVVRSCQRCGLAAEPCSSLRGCGCCDFDLCEDCFQEATYGPKRSLLCPAGKPLTSLNVELFDKVDHVCNLCGATAEVGDRVYVSAKGNFDMCEACASKAPVAAPSTLKLTCAKKASVAKPAGEKLCCPKKHVLSAIPAPANAEVTRVCNSCGDSVEECSMVMSCSKCDYDFCNKCATRALSGLSKDPNCPAGHSLTMLLVGEGQRVCNMCSTGFDEGERVHNCARCDYDLCMACARKADAAEGSVQLSGGDLVALTEARNKMVKSKRKVVKKHDCGPPGAFPVTCYQGHRVTAFPAPAASEGERVCNLCSDEIVEGESLHTCGACDFDICECCALEESRKPPVVVKEVAPAIVEEAAPTKGKKKVIQEASPEESSVLEDSEDLEDESDEEEEDDSAEMEDEDEESESEEDEGVEDTGAEGETETGASEAVDDAEETEVTMDEAPVKRTKALSKRARRRALLQAKNKGKARRAAAAASRRSGANNLTYDLRHMAAYDIAPQSATVIEAEFLAYSRDSAQMLVNKLFSLSKKRGRERAATRWESFMEERGMKKRKRSRLVFDEVSGDWKPRCGYKSAKKSKEAGEQAIYEMRAGEDPNSNPFERMKAERKLQKMKQKMREVRNKVEAGGKLSASVPELNKEAKRGTDGLREVLKRAQVSTGSRGKFDRVATNEPTNLQQKRHKAHGAMSSDKEKERYMKLAGKTLSGQSVDQEKAAKVGRKDKAKGSKCTPGKGRRSKQTQKKAARSGRK